MFSSWMQPVKTSESQEASASTNSSEVCLTDQCLQTLKRGDMSIYQIPRKTVQVQKSAQQNNVYKHQSEEPR